MLTLFFLKSWLFFHKLWLWFGIVDQPLGVSNTVVAVCALLSVTFAGR